MVGIGKHGRPEDGLNFLVQLLNTILACWGALRKRDCCSALMLEELAALARARGYVLEDLVRGMERPVEDSKMRLVVQRRPAPVKFRHPFNSELTWSGRGRQKKWVIAWLAEGRKMEDLMV